MVGKQGSIPAGALARCKAAFVINNKDQYLNETQWNIVLQPLRTAPVHKARHVGI